LRNYTAPAPAPATSSSKAVTGYSVSANWCHEDSFNVLYGDGAVKSIRDDRQIVRSNSNAPGQILCDDKLYYTTYAERVWTFFEDSRFKK
jgi:hypothetical protein